MIDYLPILLMIVLVLLFIYGSFLASELLGPKRGTVAKRAAYECGIVPETGPSPRFPVKFYLVAMAFIVLDVEVIFLYPYSTVFRGLGAYGLVAMAVFLTVLIIPFAYLISSGALDWGNTRQVLSQRRSHVLRAAIARGTSDAAVSGTHDSEAAA